MDRRGGSPKPGIVWAITAGAAVVGPGAAALHEWGALSVGPDATLWPIGSVCVAASAGIVTGVRLWRHVSRRLGLAALLPNGLVLAFYGFLLLFFGLGASR